MPACASFTHSSLPPSRSSCQLNKINDIFLTPFSSKKFFFFHAQTSCIAGFMQLEFFSFFFSHPHHLQCPPKKALAH
jgi:hypothetical protein